MPLNEPHINHQTDSEKQAPVFNEANNFKLVSGNGIVTAKETLKDDLFGLTFPHSLRLHRRVEVYTEYTGLAESENSS